MPTRVCETCRSAENPLGRLRFKKWLDGKVYCENCLPASVEVLDPTPPAVLSSGLPGTSAGSFVAIPCPECRGMSPKPHGKGCETCDSFGSVRVPLNFLKIYTAGKAKPKTQEPGIITEG